MRHVTVIVLALDIYRRHAQEHAHILVRKKDVRGLRGRRKVQKYVKNFKEPVMKMNNMIAVTTKVIHAKNLIVAQNHTVVQNLMTAHIIMTAKNLTAVRRHTVARNHAVVR